jgi:hypothetical protein
VRSLFFPQKLNRKKLEYLLRFKQGDRKMGVSYMIRQIVLIVGMGTIVFANSSALRAEPLSEPKPLPRVDSSSSSALDTIEINHQARETFFPSNSPEANSNYSDSNNNGADNNDEFDLFGDGFKLDFGDNLRSKRELDASVAPGDDGDNTKLRLLLDVTEIERQGRDRSSSRQSTDEE